MSGDKPGITTDKPKSTKTTIAGILAAAGAIATGIAAMIDGDPTTAINLKSIMAACGPLILSLGIAGVGIFSKDHKVHG